MIEKVFALFLTIVLILVGCGNVEEHNKIDVSVDIDESVEFPREVERVLDREIFIFRNDANLSEIYHSTTNFKKIKAFRENWTYGQILNDENFVDVEWSSKQTIEEAKTVTFKGKSRVLPYDVSIVVDFMVQEKESMPLACSMTVITGDETVKQNVTTFVDSGMELDEAMVVTDALVSNMICAFDTDAMTEVEVSREVSKEVRDFEKKMEGIWIDLSDCNYYGYDEVNGYHSAYFNFYSFSEEGIFWATYQGHRNRVGWFDEIEKISDDLYRGVIYYPEVDNEMDGYLEASYDEFEMKFDGDSFVGSNYPDEVYTYMGKDLDSALENFAKYYNDTMNSRNFRVIGSSVYDFLENYSNNGGVYYECGIEPFNEENNYVYSLSLTQREKGYYFPVDQMIVTARDGVIVGVYKTGLQMTEARTVRLLLEWFGEDEGNLINYAPQRIYEENTGRYYFKWEGNNGYLVINAAEYGSVDWEEYLAFNYCIFSK